MQKKRRSLDRSALSTPAGVADSGDARVYILSLSEAEQNENRWQYASKLLLEAFETGEVEAPPAS